MTAATGRVSRPSATTVAAAVAVAISLLVAFPIVTVLRSSLWSGDFLWQPGSLSFKNYAAVLADPQTGPLLGNTFVFTLGSTAVAVALGSLLAWIVARTDVPFRPVVQLLPVAPLFLPGLLKDIGWIELYSPTTGLVNLGLMKVFGLTEAPFNIFSMLGMIVNVGFNVVPLTYLLLLGPLTSLDRSLEEASRSSGSNPLRTALRITAPLLRPALLSTLALTAVHIASAFETPVLIGLPAGITTFMSAIYSSMAGGSSGPNYALASAQSGVYVLLTGLLLLWYLRSTRVESRFALLAGRGTSRAATRLGPWRFLMLAIVLVHFLIAFVQLVGINFMVSLVPFYTVTAGNPFQTLNLDNYRAVFLSSTIAPAIRESVQLSVAVSLLAVLAATVLAFVALKTRLPGRRLAEIVGTLPIAFPPLVFSIALLLTVLSVPGLVGLYGTPVPLLIADTIVFLPFALRVVASAMISIHDELLDASAAAGAGTLKTVRAIIVPLLAPAAINACVLVFVYSLRELAAVALLVTSNTTLLPTVIFGSWNTGDFGVVNVLNLVSIVVPALLLIVLLALRRLTSVTARRAAPARRGFRSRGPIAPPSEVGVG